MDDRQRILKEMYLRQLMGEKSDDVITEHDAPAQIPGYAPDVMLSTMAAGPLVGAAKSSAPYAFNLLKGLGQKDVVAAGTTAANRMIAGKNAADLPDVTLLSDEQRQAALKKISEEE